MVAVASAAPEGISLIDEENASLSFLECFVNLSQKSNKLENANRKASTHILNLILGLSQIGALKIACTHLETRVTGQNTLTKINKFTRLN